MLFDRLMTAGRASPAWQENRPRITGPYQGAMLSVARKDLSHETHNGPMWLRSPRKPVQTGKDAASGLWRRRGAADSSFLSRRPPGEGADAGGCGDMGHWLEVEPSDRGDKAITREQRY